MSHAESQNASARVQQLRGALLTGRGPGASRGRDRRAHPRPSLARRRAATGRARPGRTAGRPPARGRAGHVPHRPPPGAAGKTPGRAGRRGGCPARPFGRGLVRPRPPPATAVERATGPSARHPPERHVMTFAPSGRQFEISAGDQHATIVEVGGGIRSYRAGDRDVLQPYPPGQMCDGAHGAPLIPWPNRLADGRYRFQERTTRSRSPNRTSTTPSTASCAGAPGSPSNST